MRNTAAKRQAPRDPRVDPQPDDEFTDLHAVIKVYALTQVERKGWFVEFHVFPTAGRVAPYVEQMSLDSFRTRARRWVGRTPSLVRMTVTLLGGEYHGLTVPAPAHSAEVFAVPGANGAVLYRFDEGKRAAFATSCTPEQQAELLREWQRNA